MPRHRRIGQRWQSPSCRQTQCFGRSHGVGPGKAAASNHVIAADLRKDADKCSRPGVDHPAFGKIGPPLLKVRCRLVRLISREFAAIRTVRTEVFRVPAETRGVCPRSWGQGLVAFRAYGVVTLFNRRCSRVDGRLGVASIPSFLFCVSLLLGERLADTAERNRGELTRRGASGRRP